MRYSIYVIFKRINAAMYERIAQEIGRLSPLMPDRRSHQVTGESSKAVYQWDGLLEPVDELGLKHELRQAVESLGFPLEMDYVAYNYDDKTLSTVHIAPDLVPTRTNTFMVRSAAANKEA